MSQTVPPPPQPPATPPVEPGGSIHQWINSFGVIIAILAAGAAFWFSHQSASLKSESLGFATTPDFSCRLEHQRLSDNEWVGLCWSVTITNVSEDKTSITEYSTSDINGSIAHWDALHTLELPTGTPAVLPVTLDGGESRKFLVRVPVKTPASVTQIITAFAGSKAKSAGTISLDELSDELAKHGLDLLGNSITPIIDSGKVLGKAWEADPKRSICVLAINTGRGRQFQNTMVWPPRSGE
jgi:hypothetical protein